MTDKQIRAIRFIESILEIKYSGDTDAEASKFIGLNLNNARKCAEFEKNMYMPTFSSRLGSYEPDLDLDTDLSLELLKKNLRHGESASQAIVKFARDLFLENADE